MLFVGYGETDNWAHQGRYDLVLHAAHDFDRLREGTLEHHAGAFRSIATRPPSSSPAITAAAAGTEQWKEHGVEQPGSENVWIAVMGPDTPHWASGHRSVAVTQSQIAATLAGLIGKDYPKAEPAAAAPIADVLGGGQR